MAKSCYAAVRDFECGRTEKGSSLFKVGFTTRKTIDRRAELNRTAQRHMWIMASVSMPYARACETRLLRKLAKDKHRQRDHRGTEWFHLRPGEHIDDIAKRLVRASRWVEIRMRLSIAWPISGKRKIWRANRRHGGDRKITGRAQ
jgi:hypothetical protein